MNKKFLFLAVFLVSITMMVSGCGQKQDVEQPAEIGESGGNIDNNQEQDQGAQNERREINNFSGEYTINELLSIKRPLKCSWKESVTQGGEVTNLIYVTGEKFYQEVTMGDIGHVYTISDGEYFYIWNDFSPTASKMNIKEMEKESQPAQQQTGNAVNVEQKRDFVCEEWQVDSSVFNPPIDKDFQDITEEMVGVTNDLMENADKYKQQACDMCRQAPTEELRNECLTNAQCN